MRRINTNRKAVLAVVYWAMITIAMPQLAALGSGVHAAPTTGRCSLNELNLVHSSEQIDSATVLYNSESNGEKQSAPALTQIESWTPVQDLFVVTLEKQILDYLGQELPQQHVVCHPPVPAYAELIIQLPTQPTLRRLEIMIQI